MTTSTSDNAAIMHILGQIQGENRAMFNSLSNDLLVIREDIKRVEATSQAQVRHLEENLNLRLGMVDRRINNLELQDKIHIKQIATNGALSGGISGALITGFVELAKHLIK